MTRPFRDSHLTSTPFSINVSNWGVVLGKILNKHLWIFQFMIYASACNNCHNQPFSFPRKSFPLAQGAVESRHGPFKKMRRNSRWTAGANLGNRIGQVKSWKVYEFMSVYSWQLPPTIDYIPLWPGAYWPVERHWHSGITIINYWSMYNSQEGPVCGMRTAIHGGNATLQ